MLFFKGTSFKAKSHLYKSEIQPFWETLVVVKKVYWELNFSETWKRTLMLSRFSRAKRSCPFLKLQRGMEFHQYKKMIYSDAGLHELCKIILLFKDEQCCRFSEKLQRETYRGGETFNLPICQSTEWFIDISADKGKDSGVCEVMTLLVSMEINLQIFKSNHFFFVVAFWSVNIKKYPVLFIGQMCW